MRKDAAMHYLPGILLRMISLSISLPAKFYKLKAGNIYERKLGGGHCTSP